MLVMYQSVDPSLSVFGTSSLDTTQLASVLDRHGNDYPTYVLILALQQACIILHVAVFSLELWLAMKRRGC